MRLKQEITKQPLTPRRREDMLQTVMTVLLKDTKTDPNVT